MSIHADRIIKTMKQKSISYGELSKRTKIPKSALQRYATGETAKIPLNRIEDISKALQISPAYIMGWSDDPHSELPSGMQIYDPVVHEIPILGTIAAGLPIYAEQNIEEYTYTDRNGGSEYFALRVKGDSMNAANISEGSLLIVRCQPAVENGEIAVVMVNNENATVKYFRRDDNIVQLIPRSYNPVHQIQIYDLRNDKISIIGKVVECKTEF